jgi:hypothetical protein
MRCSPRRSLALVVLAFGIDACARPAPTPPPAPRSPQEALAAVAAREAAIRTLRAQFSADAVQPDGSRRRVSGVLLVSKPTGQFRFRLMLPFGVTVLDYVHHRDGDWVTLPLARENETTPQIESIWRMDLATAFLREDISPDECQVSIPSGPFVTALCGGRHLWIRTSDATVAREGNVRYGEQRPVDGVLLAFRIEMGYRADVSVTVRVERYELNPTLDDSLFDVPPGAHRLWVR